MDDARTTLPCLDNEAEANRMVLGHIRAHDDDAVTLGQAGQSGCGSTSSESGAQTGHRAGVSYAGLVFNGDDPEPPSEELFDEIVLFVVECCAAQVRNAERPVDH